MNTSFSVCMMLEAVNRMGPSLTTAMRQVNQLKQQLRNVPKSVTTTVRIKRIEETVKKLRETASRATSKAVQDGATGAALMAPIAKTVKDFAQAEDSFTLLKIASYDASISMVKMQEELKKATLEAQRLGDITRFSTREAYEGMTTLVKGGANLNDVYSGLGQSALYLAQAGNVDVNQSAEAMVKISNSYQLSGEQMKGVADMINRVDGASTASISSLQEGFKYAAGAASQIKQSVEQTAQALAVLNNRGLDGSTAGTNYADMLQRLIPQTKQQTAYMRKLGWIREDGHSVFFDDDKVKEMPIIIKVMRDSLRGMRPDDQLKYLHKIFGEQGGRAAMAIMQEGRGSWEEVGSNISKAMPLNQRIGVQSKTLGGRFENMMGSIQNLSAESGSPIGTFLSERLDGVTEMINATRTWSNANPEVVKGIMWIVTSLGMLKIGSMVFHLMKSGVLGFVGNLLTVVGGLGKVKNGFSILTAAYKSARLTGLGFGKSITQGLTAAWPWFGKLAGGAGKIGSELKGLGARGGLFGLKLASGAKTALKGLRSLSKLGVGIGKAMGKDSLIAIKAIGGVGKAVGKFTKKWLINAGRVATGWLIAMGPPGWIILGVTALIIAGVAAWKTNFMGFRDKCISVWNTIKDWSSRTVGSICGFVSRAMDKLSGFIDRIKQALGLVGELDQKQHIWGPVRGLDLKGPNVPYLNPDKGSRSQTFNQTNNLTLPSMDLATEYTKKVTPEPYRNDNPNFNVPANGYF